MRLGCACCPRVWNCTGWMRQSAFWLKSFASPLDRLTHTWLSWIWCCPTFNGYRSFCRLATFVIGRRQSFGFRFFGWSARRLIRVRWLHDFRFGGRFAFLIVVIWFSNIWGRRRRTSQGLFSSWLDGWWCVDFWLGFCLRTWRVGRHCRGMFALGRGGNFRLHSVVEPCQQTVFCKMMEMNGLTTGKGSREGSTEGIASDFDAGPSTSSESEYSIWRSAFSAVEITGATMWCSFRLSGEAATQMRRTKIWYKIKHRRHAAYGRCKTRFWHRIFYMHVNCAPWCACQLVDGLCIHTLDQCPSDRALGRDKPHLLYFTLCNFAYCFRRGKSQMTEADERENKMLGNDISGARMSQEAGLPSPFEGPTFNFKSRILWFIISRCLGK